MAFRFELFIAQRYLKAKRRQAAISVITAISIAGVAAGVMALVIAIAINNGFRTTLQKNLLGATAHVTVTERIAGAGISDWRELSKKLAALPGTIEASPALYEKVFVNAGPSSSGAIIKGLDLTSPRLQKDLVPFIKQGSLDNLRQTESDLPQLLIGSKLAESLGLQVGNYLQVINPMGELTPFGPRPSYHRLRIAGIVETGFYDVDANFTFMNLPELQKMMSLGDVVNAVEIKIADIEAAPAFAEIAQKAAGTKYIATNWMEQNRQLLGALKMERIVSLITIGLIQLVAALNIFITLIMMVMEKQRDIAILLSMGTRTDQIRRIFIYQGLLIGVMGSAIGLALGYGISFVADHYRLIELSEEIYSIPYVPFQPNPLDALWITAFALAVSLVATLYPANSATKVAPAESLRYE
ncbi:FtsX-like permease family protein [Bryobacter aggregatus]|uniref:FtsX-like permease family protein n=1 Tax=Bryobacter aggregatus TaxID=360054 RepID=UPI0004E23618|nr:FtsX-like permease family protein [Bryobacter aggregatus]